MTKLAVETKKTHKVDKLYTLVLLNDNINSIDHIILSLVAVCCKPMQQAEQIAILAHYKGSCDVTSSEFHVVREMKEQLFELNIKTKIVCKD